MPLERETVARAALAVLDEVGLDGLTVRRIADALGVQNPALYWHFKNKQDLLDRMAEAMLADAFAELGPPAPDASWSETLSALAHLFHRALSSHRDGARVIAAANLSGSETVGVLDTTLKTLQDAGFEHAGGAQRDADRLRLHHGLRARCATRSVQRGGSAPRGVRHVTWRCGSERYPALAGALGEVARVSTGQDRTAAFEAGLQLILAGIGASLPARER